MINFLHTFHPEPIFLSFGPIHIYWYGLFIVLGMLAAIVVALELADKYGVDKNLMMDIAFWLIISGLVGARLYHVVLEFSYYQEHLLDILKIWRGGIAIHGGIFAGLIFLYFYLKKGAQNFWTIAGIIAPALALAQAIGRFGNYFNQELFGKPTNLPWGIPIDPANRVFPYYSDNFFQPAFLYESLGNLFIFAVLICIHARLLKKNIKSAKYGLLMSCAYLIMYSILRFFMEFIRIDPAAEILSLRFAQITSLSIILAASATITAACRHPLKSLK